ncbi:MAG TPA: small, acid-soluble spore protein, alpha/beta type [Syntrophomonas sp.]|nr:small, acid-soluble spore protein, alpha/beta type [Syntrophomonas sp.]HRW11977.1 small, acid-soluble spore protein, alpha/beta type [Syntrophomonas sp.]
MKKTSGQQQPKKPSTNDAGNQAMENLKYEVAQEMGIKPKTKNKKS